jgi:hypothetical protein
MVINRARIALLIFLATGCGQGDSDQASATTTDSAGVTIVVSQAADQPLPWNFVSEFFIGGEDAGPEAFSSASPGLVRTNGSDRITVLDTDAHLVHVFDGSGRFLRSVGGEGSGPGEFQLAFRLLDVGPGRIGLTDFGKPARLVWSLEGELLEESRNLDQSTGQDRVVVRGDTLVLEWTENDSVSATTRLVQIIDKDTTTFNKLVAPPRQMVELSCLVAAIPPMFSPRIHWASIGSLIAGVTSSSYVVSIFKSGTLARSVRRAIEPKPTSPEDAGRQYPDGWSVSFGGGQRCTMEGPEVAEKTGMAETLPVISGVAIGLNGELWVQRHSFPGDTPVVDVFDAAGVYLGTVVGRGLPLGWLGPDRILFAVEDNTTGITRIGVYTISID